MNKARRKEIDAIIKRIDDIKTDVEGIRDEEQDYFDNMPEGFQMGEKGELAEAAANELEYAADGFDAIIDNLNEAMT